MTFKLGKNIQIGNQIKTENGWRAVLGVREDGAITSGGVVSFGSIVYGWKSA